jgi:TonB family protein
LWTTGNACREHVAPARAPKLDFRRQSAALRPAGGGTGRPSAAIPAGGGALPKTENNPRLTAGIMHMNTKSKLVLSLGLLVAPLALLAKSPEKIYVESYLGRSGTPVPVSVVTPEVGPQFAGSQVMLEFVVDATGKPTQIVSVTPGANAELVAAVSDAVAQWKFAPAQVDGKPVARKVVLPVTIVDSFDNASRVAMR